MSPVMRPVPHARLPRPLLWCTVLALLAHAWLLQTLPDALRMGGSMGRTDLQGPRVQQTLTLRRIEAPAAAATATAAGPAATTARRATRAPGDGAAPQAVAPALALAPAQVPVGASPGATPIAIPLATPVATPPGPSMAAAVAEPPAPAPTPAPAASSPPTAASQAAAHAGASAPGAPLGPLAIPGSTRLRYVVFGESRGRPYQVSATLQWQHDGRQYDARYEVSAWLLGARTQTSRGLLGTDGLAPTRFGDRFRSEQAAHFQRDKGLISFSSNAPDAALRAGAQDRLSVLLQLAAIVGGDPQRHPPQSVLQVQVASTRDADLWQFRVIGEQTLQLPGGTMTALKLERLPRREYDQHIEVWLAPSLDHLPVRVRITQGNGDVLDQQWLSRDTP